MECPDCHKTTCFKYLMDMRVVGPPDSAPLRIMLHGWLKEPIGL